jgi:hypothetical protein
MVTDLFPLHLRVDGEVAPQVGQRERSFPECTLHQPVHRVLNFPI